ncbi:MAG TPA: nitrous oxide reductase accessory protein NosL [Geobacteraceae bacterium]
MTMVRKAITAAALFFLGTLPAHAGSVEPPVACEQCGMDRSAFAKTRTLIVYADGTSEGTCSFQCAITRTRRHGEREVKVVKVADYVSGKLIDAGSATWVTGGKEAGVMTSLPKWAFASEVEARKFIEKHGGTVTQYEEVLRLAAAEADGASGASHDHHDHMGPGSQLVFNPAFGDDIYHTHPAGMWMASYKFMHTNQRGLRAGGTNVPVERVIPVGSQYGFMMAPTAMTMDMHMFMIMYGVTGDFTLMGMANYQENRMEMLMDMGMGSSAEPPMRTSGIGDTELRGAYKINTYLVGSLGLSIPTGDIKQSFETMGMTFRAPYDMQLGSGTFDLKPALTLNVLSGDAAWNWGGQVSYTNHVGKNAAGYSLGDNVKVTGWLQRALGPGATWLRLAFSNTGRIDGRDSEIDKLLDPVMGAPTPDADPHNYGGQRLDGFIGASYAAGPISLGVEGGIPLYQYLNGLQLKNDWYLTAGVQAMF